MVIAIALPWLVFFLITCLFLFAFQDLEVFVWILVAACVGLSLLFLGLGLAAKHPLFVAIGALCLFFCVAATALGLWLDDTYLQRYALITDSKAFKDIDPTGDPNLTRTAGVIHFKKGSFVDDRRTVGWIDDSIYCVAPVVTPTTYSTDVQYWATGEDCCEQRSNFDCGDAREADVVTAIIAEEDPRFRDAIAMAESVYQLKSSKSAQLVELTRDASQVASDIWDECFSIALVAGAAALVISAMAGILLARVMSKARPKPGVGGALAP